MNSQVTSLKPRLIPIGRILCVWLALVPIAFADKWTLGEYELEDAASSGPLEAVTEGAKSLSTYSFVGKVGGVAFGAIAVPGRGVKAPMDLIYDRERPDGSRLVVEMSGRRLNLPLEDWLLVPIARFVDSEFNACVSLFGPKSSETQHDVVYHEALEDTLLGLRLFQADVLLTNMGETWQLPKFEGEVILGKGETAPEKLPINAVIEAQNLMKTHAFQAWVLTDAETRIEIKAEGEKIELGGEPYFHFWRSDFRKYELEIKALEAEAAKFRVLGEIEAHNEVIKKANALEPDVLEVKALTDKLRQHSDTIRKVNPVVFDAAQTTMRFSAFFRWIKKTNPEGWRTFVESVELIDTEPAISTPTRWPKGKKAAE